MESSSQWYSQIALEKVFFMYATVIPEHQHTHAIQQQSHRGAPYSKTARDMCMIDLEGFRNFVHDCPNLLDQDDFVYKDCEQIFLQQIARRNQQHSQNVQRGHPRGHEESSAHTWGEGGGPHAANFEVFVDTLRKIACCKYMSQDPETDYARLLAKHVFLLLGKQMKQSRSRLLQQKQSFSCQRQYRTQHTTTMGSPKGRYREAQNQTRHGNTREASNETENQLRSLVDCSFASSQGEYAGDANDIVYTWEHDLEERTKTALNIDSNTFASFRDNATGDVLRSPASKSPESRRRASQLAQSASPIQKADRKRVNQGEEQAQHLINSTYSTIHNQTGLSRTDSRENLFTQEAMEDDGGQVKAGDSKIAQETIHNMENRLRAEFDSAQNQVYRSMKSTALGRLERLVCEKRIGTASKRLAILTWKNVHQASSSWETESKARVEVDRLNSILQGERQRYENIQSALVEEQHRAERAESRIAELNAMSTSLHSSKIIRHHLERETKGIADVAPSVRRDTDILKENDVTVCRGLWSWVLLFMLCTVLSLTLLIIGGTTGQFDSGGKLEQFQYILDNPFVKDLLLRLGNYFAPMPCIPEGHIYVDCDATNAGNSIFSCGSGLNASADIHDFKAVVDE
eukprot:gb/GECG01001765.1/.p1 GENE.gb/GECG01001765.1/~~gb/GECG01001765.1/.p1  ORF type:complete len:631 (+),score=81.86 gb/GECG01001765.1/:1-1893(+)